MSRSKPSALAPGTRVCDQGFLFGPPADVPQRLASNRVCFTVGRPASIPPTTPPCTSPGAPPEAPGPGGPGLPPSGGSGPGGPGSPGPGSPGPGLPPGGGGRVPSADTSVTVPPPLSPPAPAPAPAASPAASTGAAEGARSPAGAPEEATPNLPRTGRDDRPLAAAGGANLIAAGLALIAGARHRRQRGR